MGGDVCGVGVGCLKGGGGMFEGWGGCFGVGGGMFREWGWDVCGVGG